MRIRFLEAAQREVDDAVAWNDEREEDSGRDFLDELDRVIRRVKSFPLASTEIEPGIRRCLLARSHTA
jgi:plasmid stabilization system protein ParE